jgi:hypothetical protein
MLMRADSEPPITEIIEVLAISDQVVKPCSPQEVRDASRVGDVDLRAEDVQLGKRQTEKLVEQQH